MAYKWMTFRKDGAIYNVSLIFEEHYIDIRPVYEMRVGGVGRLICYSVEIDYEEINRSFKTLDDAKTFAIDKLECTLAVEGKIHNIESFKDFNGKIGKVGSKIYAFVHSNTKTVIALKKQGRAGVKVFFKDEFDCVGCELNKYVEIVEEEATD